MTSPYRQSVLPVAARLRWRRLAWCFALLLAATSVAALLAVGTATFAGTEWNASWKLLCGLGLLVGVPLLVLLVVAVLPYTIWIRRERSWMHPGLLRTIAWTWRLAVGLTVASVVMLAIVQAHPAPPPPDGKDWGALFSFGGC